MSETILPNLITKPNATQITLELENKKRQGLAFHMKQARLIVTRKSN